jgi:hypothetical protein
LFKGEDSTYPFTGAWRQEKIQSILTHFYGLNSQWKLSSTESAAYLAYESTSLSIQPWLKKVEKQPKIYRLLPDYFLDNFPFREVSNKTMFRLSENSTENTRMWKSFYIRLRRKFHKLLVKGVKEFTIDDIYKKYCDNHPTYDVIPPYGQSEVHYITNSIKATGNYTPPFKNFDIGTLWEAYVKDPRFMYYIAKMTLGKSMGIVINEETRNMLAFRFQARARLVSETSVLQFNEVPIPPNWSFNYFHDPLVYLKVMDELCGNWIYLVPTYISQEKKDLLTLRDFLFPKNFEDWIKVSNLHSRAKLVYSFYLRIFPDRAANLLHLLLKSNRLLGKFLPIESNKGQFVWDELERLMTLKYDILRNGNILHSLGRIEDNPIGGLTLIDNEPTLVVEEPVEFETTMDDPIEDFLLSFSGLSSKTDLINTEPVIPAGVLLSDSPSGEQDIIMDEHQEDVAQIELPSDLFQDPEDDYEDLPLEGADNQDIVVPPEGDDAFNTLFPEGESDELPLPPSSEEEF